MADGYQIRNVMNSLGTLWASEHHEGDDDGVTQVETLVKGLRRFKQHEDDEHEQRRAALAAVTLPALREATYQVADGRHVFYDDGKESLRDAADLYAVLPEETPSGSPNLENLKARHILDRLQTGMGLGEQHIGTLRDMMRRHHSAINTLRAQHDRGGQDPLEMASEGPDSRIIEPQEA